MNGGVFPQRNSKQRQRRRILFLLHKIWAASFFWNSKREREKNIEEKMAGSREWKLSDGSLLLVSSQRKKEKEKGRKKRKKLDPLDVFPD